ncbi:MAG: plastocyanin [Hyphomicrobiaceae bacterium]|jgi:plastocyanin
MTKTFTRHLLVPALAVGLVTVSVLAAQAGSVTGTVTFDGDVPNRRPVKMAADPSCEASNPDGRLGEVMVVSADKQMANVFVYVKSEVTGEFDLPEAAHLDQNGCMYTPHVTGVMIGQTIEIKNSDGTLHNVHSLPENSAQFNNAMPIKNQVIKKKFSAEEVMVRVKCDVHPWMSAYIGVLPHPFFATSSTDGSFTIESLPAGTYELEAWHERLGTKTQSVTVGADGSVTADFSFAPPSK